MNTKTMRLPPRRISTTTIASSNSNTTTPKRKERDNNSASLHAPIPAKSLKLSSNQTEPSNHLLDGYLAHEFLTKGTLLGQLCDPTTRSVDDPTVQKSPDRRGAEAEPECEKRKRYVEVADLLKTDGARLPGIVNPSQLARFLQLYNVGEGRYCVWQNMNVVM